MILCLSVGCSFKKTKIREFSNDSSYIDNNSNEVINSMKVIIDDKEYKVNLENNETTKEFINKLPQTFNMMELNGNEKYTYLDYTLPTNEYLPKYINKGDIMLYGNNCLVIFYESFSTSYSYTKIGHIDDLSNIGKESILVHFEK